jgi:hypothetical protein
MRIALRPSQRQHILEGGCDAWISPIDSPVEIGTVAHSKHHEKLQILSFNKEQMRQKLPCLWGK